MLRSDLALQRHLSGRCCPFFPRRYRISDCCRRRPPPTVRDDQNQQQVVRDDQNQQPMQKKRDDRRVGCLLLFLIRLAEDGQVVERSRLGSCRGGFLARFILEGAGGYGAPTSPATDEVNCRDAGTRGRWR